MRRDRPRLWLPRVPVVRGQRPSWPRRAGRQAGSPSRARRQAGCRPRLPWPVSPQPGEAHLDRAARSRTATDPFDLGRGKPTFGGGQERAQEVHLAGGEGNGGGGTGKDHALRVEPEDGVGGGGQPAFQRADGGHQLARGGGFGKVDVGPAFIPVLAFGRIDPRGEHDDADGPVIAAQAAGEGDAILARQVEVEDEDPRDRLGRGCAEGFDIGIGRHGETFVRKHFGERFAQVEIVLDDGDGQHGNVRWKRIVVPSGV